MTNDPPEPNADTIHTPLGASIGGAIVVMLREHTPCDCPRCQLNVIKWAVRWCLHGNDIRLGLPALDALLVDLHKVRRILRQHHRFNTAMEGTMEGHATPDTDGRPN